MLRQKSEFKIVEEKDADEPKRMMKSKFALKKFPASSLSASDCKSDISDSSRDFDEPAASGQEERDLRESQKCNINGATALKQSALAKGDNLRVTSISI
eukprot:CAMPEP_0170451162 /NCGR_PEP_ID=MMETSP0123-20130129/493_1 /TAXON_ID=182087 /ORGANISM="Favella ehrenbergii, Strain Fehren 1" /LENGTH=98 /DNA_ID=CAMNT_0010712757 /DNA_START=984 /DNA_END=1280 /DNA_ORIENTATION=+